MSPIDEIAKLLVPGTGTCFAISFFVGTILLAVPRWWRRAGAALIAATVLVYVALGNPIVCGALEQGLAHPFTTIRHPGDANGARAIVIIGNGVTTHLHGDHYVHEMKPDTADNVVEGTRLFRLLSYEPGTRNVEPPLVIVSGGIADPVSQARPEADMMREALASTGVPVDRILMDRVSRNTYEQAREVASILAAARIDRFVVVTAPTHMQRVSSLFHRRGLSPVPSVPLIRAMTSEPRPWPFSFVALAGSREAAYEYMALAGYWLRGRI